MEKVATSKCRSFHRHHKRPPAIRVGVCAERDSDEVRREAPERGSDCPGESPHCSDRVTDNTIFSSYWVWQKVSITFTQTM